MAEALAKGLGPDGKAQLTPFIEQIITTGSGVSKAMLLVLVIAFIVKCFEHIVNYIKRKRALSKVKSAISTTRAKAVDEYDEGNPNFDRLSYVQYNAEFKAANEMDEMIRQGINSTTDKRKIMQLLNQRAFELMQRRALLMRNEQSVTRAYRMDMLPLEVWNDFQAAKESLQLEMQKMQFLCAKFGIQFQQIMQYASQRYKENRQLRQKLNKRTAQLRNSRQPKKRIQPSPSVPKSGGTSPGRTN